MIENYVQNYMIIILDRSYDNFTTPLLSKASSFGVLITFITNFYFNRVVMFVSCKIIFSYLDLFKATCYIIQQNDGILVSSIFHGWKWLSLFRRQIWEAASHKKSYNKLDSILQNISPFITDDAAE
jgi:hypothetical protein